MPLTSSPPQSVRPRRLTFTSDSAQQQYQSAMKSVQQYLGAHMPAEQLELLGVNDFRARYYYDEIQQYLAQRVRHEKQQAIKQQQPQQPSQAQRHFQRLDSDRLLLQNLDEFLDELDPALFEPYTKSERAAQSGSQGFSSNGSQVPSRMKRPCSYIKEMQQEARMYQHFCRDAADDVVKKHKSETMKECNLKRSTLQQH